MRRLTRPRGRKTEGWVASNRGLRKLAVSLAYFSGAARILAARRGGIGAILRFERIRPARRDAFQPLRSGEITPARLDREEKSEVAARVQRRWEMDR